MPISSTLSDRYSDNNSWLVAMTDGGSIGQRFLSFFTTAMKETKPESPSGPAFDPEQVTKEERISRLLHQPSPRGKLGMEILMLKLVRSSSTSSLLLDSHVLAGLASTSRKNRFPPLHRIHTYYFAILTMRCNHVFIPESTFLVLWTSVFLPASPVA